MSQSWKVELIRALSQELPGERSHRKLLPAERNLESPAHGDAVKTSGVIVLLVPEGDDLYGCLVRRSRHLSHHPGQVGFPGGKKEPDEFSPLEAAIRECAEEIGAGPEQYEILGALTPLFVPVSKYLVHPFLAWSYHRPSLTLNPEEVEKLIWFPVLKDHRVPVPERTEALTGSGSLRVPAFRYDGEIIWGATAMILSELADLLTGLQVKGETKPRQ